MALDSAAHLGSYVRAFLGSIPATLLGGEVVYALIPIGIIFALDRAAAHPTSDILMWREWSFGTIVIAGAAMRRFIETKERWERDPSNLVFYLLILFVLLLIGASLILAVLVLKQANVEFAAGLSQRIIGGLQLTLFLLATCSLFMVNGIQTRFLGTAVYDPAAYTPAETWRFVEFSKDQARHALQDIGHIIVADSGLVQSWKAEGKRILALGQVQEFARGLE